MNWRLWPAGKWLPISIAPMDRPLELCVIEEGEVCALVFPCRQGAGAQAGAWLDAGNGAKVDVHPTHWRLWSEQRPDI